MQGGGQNEPRPTRQNFDPDELKNVAKTGLYNSIVGISPTDIVPAPHVREARLDNGLKIMSSSYQLSALSFQQKSQLKVDS